jgi:hypothetical protein
MRGLMNFPGIFAILFDFLINVEARDRYHASPPQHSHAASCAPHARLGPLEQPFHGIHEHLQRVRFATDELPALPFDWIQSRLARVDLDRRTSSIARTPTASGLYLAHRRHRDAHFRSILVLPMRLRMILILKISYSHFILTSRCRTTSYYA